MSENLRPEDICQDWMERAQNAEYLVAELNARVAQLEAACAAMREALEGIRGLIAESQEELQAALSTDALAAARAAAWDAAEAAADAAADAAVEAAVEAAAEAAWAAAWAAARDAQNAKLEEMLEEAKRDE